MQNFLIREKIRIECKEDMGFVKTLLRVYSTRECHSGKRTRTAVPEGRYGLNCVPYKKSCGSSRGQDHLCFPIQKGGDKDNKNRGNSSSQHLLKLWCVKHGALGFTNSIAKPRESSMGKFLSPLFHK